MEKMKPSVVPISHGLLFDYNDGNFHTLVFGVTEETLSLPAHYTHMGIVLSGTVVIKTDRYTRTVSKDEYFSVSGHGEIEGNEAGTRAAIISAENYAGPDLLGGPVGAKGNLKYIDGCTDSLLIPPIRMGDACLNHLHFPAGTTQTQHTHPSVRAGIILRGEGVCVLTEGNIALLPGQVFLLPTETLHSFDTKESFMDVIAFHPDSDFGPTDDDHPMINRTIVEGVSANTLDDIRTK